MQAPTSVTDFLITLRRDGSNDYSGMGFLCGDWIFTCAHLLPGSKIRYGHSAVMMATRWCDRVEGTFAVLHASDLDFMVLAPDSPSLRSSELGGTETSWDVIEAARAGGVIFQPTELEFASINQPVQLPGYFFGSEGSSVHPVTLTVSSQSPFVRFASEDGVPGCSGGPIFTADHHLIGVLTNSTSEVSSRLGIAGECTGVRLDQAIPRYLYSRISWRSLRV